uniref:Thioredoxin domain-containing protein n=1 Tax=viral metagenome TaxID=1070528 RepID=A0A6C0B1M4_9ZZZZ
MSKNVRFGPMQSLTQATGTGSILSRIKNSMNWTTIGIIVLVIVLAVIAYYVYKNNVEPMTNPVYKANREHIPTGQDQSKDAEIMLFSTDWCPHCKTAKPEWEQVKAEYEGKQINGYTILFTEVNCTNETPDVEQMINRYKIEGYPTIKLVKDNQVIDYDAKPTKATLIQFLNTVV